MNIKQIDFPKGQYLQEEHPKKQIYLHHTAGNPDGEGTFRYWATNNERVATCVTITGKIKDKPELDGLIVQGFPSKHWAYHLGIPTEVFAVNKIPYQRLDKISIGIEVCNWGPLKKEGNKFYNYVGREVPADEVCTLAKPYKNYLHWHNYTDQQIESIKDLLLYWKQKYNIPITYNEDIWAVTPRALRGEAGVFTHNSVRKDKADVYPHPKLIEMLKSLS
jgi:N-acetyl-anhydromuramyl-L-alanine amidase AmpD